MQRRTWVPFAICVAASLAAGGLGSIFTIPNIDTWYASLVQPSWTPPNWVFGPVWNTLYILMGIAAGFVWISKKPGKKLALGLFFVHLIINFAWSLVFFGQQNPEAGLLIIGVLWLFIVALMATFWKFSHRATYLLIPYLLWVSYASTLNLGIVLLNP